MCKHCNNEVPGYDTTCTDCIHRLCMTAKTWEHYKNIVYAIGQSYKFQAPTSDYLRRSLVLSQPLGAKDEI